MSHLRWNDWPLAKHAVENLGLGLVFALTLCLSACGSSAPNRPIQPVPAGFEDIGFSDSPVLWGYVEKIEGQDTVPAPGAQVWAEPGPVATVADSVGYWELGLETSLRPGRYIVWAQQGELEGSTREILAQLGSETGDVFVYLGAESHVWEPIEGFDPNVGASRGRVMGRVRCCAPKEAP